MHIDNTTGLLSDARFVASPNCDERPDEKPVSLVVIHGISLPPDEYGGPWIDALFTNTLPINDHPYFAEIEHLRVSSHLLIRRDGEIVQYVPFNKRAWHAGVSCYDGEEKCNDFSIGIELEGCDDLPFEDSQYESLVRLTQTLFEGYSRLNPNQIVGHCDVSPGRKTDPGPCFDWNRYLDALE